MGRTVEIPVWLDVHELAATPTDDRSWVKEAACAGKPPTIFMPPIRPGFAPNFYEAARICFSCPARVSCLATWLANTPIGVDSQTNTYVGGTTPAQRAVIRRMLKAVVM